MHVPLISTRLRRSRVKALVDVVATHEQAMRNALAGLIELTEEGDDLHVECRRLLEALDG